MSVSPQEFGELLRKLRKQKKLTLKQIEKKTGYSNSYLSQIENGKKGIPKERLLVELAQALDISPKSLKEKVRLIGDNKIANDQKEIDLKDVLNNQFVHLYYADNLLDERKREKIKKLLDLIIESDI